MIRKFFLIILLIVLGLIASTSQAATLYLKDGRVLKGKIVEKTATYIKMEVDRVSYKYGMDEVDRLEEQDMAELKKDEGVLQTQNIPDSKMKVINTFIDLAGTRRGIEENIEQIMKNAPEDKKEELNRLFNINEIIQALIPVYDKYYTEDDLKEMVRFYQSPVGQKVLKSSPQIMKETMAASIKYFQEKLQKEKEPAP